MLTLSNSVALITAIVLATCAVNLGSCIDLTTSLPPTTTLPPDPRCSISLHTPYGPVGGNSTYSGTADPAATKGQYLNITHMIMLLESKLGLDAAAGDAGRLSIPESEISFAGTTTTFTVHFLPISTPAPGPTSVFTTTSTTRAQPQLTFIELGQYLRELFITHQAALLLPYQPTKAEFWDVPASTPVPETQEPYTPVQTIDPDAGNATFFKTPAEDNAEIVAITVSIILGVIIITAGLLAYKSYAEKQALEDKPSGMKWHRKNDYL